MAARVLALTAASALLGACALVVGIGDLPAPGGDAGPASGDAPAEGPSDFDGPQGADGGGDDARDAPSGADVGADARGDAPRDGTTNDAPDAPPGDGGPLQKKVFVTSGLLQSSMLTDADTQCNTFASLAGLGGTYVAWLSTDDKDAIAKLPTGNIEWHLLDGNSTLVFAGVSEISKLAQPHVAINVTEQKAMLAVPCDVWTGTLDNGLREGGKTCGSWLLSGGTATVGDCTATAGWSGARTDTCGADLARLYCFEK
jgi:hypothetical protein